MLHFTVLQWIVNICEMKSAASGCRKSKGAISEDHQHKHI